MVKNRKWDFTERILIIGIVLIALSYLDPICNSFLYADDFKNSLSLYPKDASLIFRIKDSIRWAVAIYKSWQGTYFQNIVHALFSPLNGWGILQLRVFLLASYILFVVAILCGAGIICDFFEIQDKRYRLTVTFELTFLLLGFIYWTENFYWYTSAVGYLIPFSFGIIGISLLKKNKILLAGLMVFCAAGGSLQISGSICFLLLCCLIKKRFIDKGCWWVFLISVLGSLINVLAPGNYVRHDMIDNTGLHFGWAIEKTFFSIEGELINLLCNGFFVFAFIIILVMHTCILNVNLDLKERWVVILLPLWPAVGIFPVLLGSQDYANRNRSILHAEIIIVLLIAMIILASGIRKLSLPQKYVAIIVVSVILVLAGKRYNATNHLIFINNYRNAYNGLYKGYSMEVDKVYSEIALSDEMDVVVYADLLPVDGFLDSGLTDDPESFVNSSLASYYEKNSVKVLSSEN